MSSCWQGIYTLATHICPVHEHTGFNLRAGGSSFHYRKLANICCFRVSHTPKSRSKMFFFYFHFRIEPHGNHQTGSAGVLKFFHLQRKWRNPVRKQVSVVEMWNNSTENWIKQVRKLFWFFFSIGFLLLMLVQTQMLQSSSFFFFNSQTWRWHRAFLGCFGCCTYSSLQTQHS